MNDFQVQLDEGVLYQKNGRLSPAIRHYTQAIQLNPNEPFPYQLRAVAYYDSGQYQSALHDFNEAIRLTPYNDVLYWARGKLFFALEDFSVLRTLNNM